MDQIHPRRFVTAKRRTRLPRGQYICRVERARRSPACQGNDRWEFVFVVDYGPYEGSRIRDQIVVARDDGSWIRYVSACLGFEEQDAGRLEPDDFRGSACLVDVAVALHFSDKGRPVWRQVVPQSGYAPLKELSQQTSGAVIV